MLETTEYLDKRIATTLYVISAFIAVILTLQIFLGYQYGTYYPPMYIFVLISNVIIIPLLVYMARINTKFLLPVFVWVHLSMGALFTTFSHPYGPFTLAWSILILISSLYYGWRGFWSSAISLTFFVSVFISLEAHKYRFADIVNYVLVASVIVGLTVVMSYIFYAIIRSVQQKNKQLMRSQESEIMQVNRLTALLNSINDSVLTVNRSGVITSQNAAAQAFFDTNVSLIGQKLDKVMKVSNEEGKKVKASRLIRSGTVSSQRDDLSMEIAGESRRLNVKTALIHGVYNDNSDYGAVLIISDITKQKTLEEEQEEFISVTSHELRTPVAIVEGSLSNYKLMEEKGVPQEKLDSIVDTAHNQAVYLARMINDLATLSRAEQSKGDVIEDIDLHEVFEALVAQYTPDADKKSLGINVYAPEDLPVVSSSRLYIAEILQNLLSNSIKYTESGSVTIGAEKVDSGHVRLRVKDTGLGMSRADQEHIFEKFYRSEDYRTRTTGGTGLGLYIVSRLAAKLNTKIEVDSKLGSGTTASFVIDISLVSFGTLED